MTTAFLPFIEGRSRLIITPINSAVKVLIRGDRSFYLTTFGSRNSGMVQNYR
ncbi:MAG: hypothetical protein HC879_09935 [Leptolyngbyaceae cyanobacterium SL_5_9]|nr:hypothetical protein [Leptolyngbyaceae cyanobacterium SL_5_9]NJO72980.1 hypothetical protein [Leptolyngbyaceae cyanobacterium RM1_406_9]